MSPDPPAGARRGDVIQTHGADASSTAPRSTVAVVDDLAAGAVAAAAGRRRGGRAGRGRPAALFWRRRLAWRCSGRRSPPPASGWWQFPSLPAETGPLLVWWLLPAVAAASLLLALVLGRRLVSYALVLLAALELGVWVCLRRDGAFRALIPTDAPFWLDRGVMAATGGRRRRGRRRGGDRAVPPAGMG